MKDAVHAVHLLQDYLDGALPPAQREEVEAHLRGCAVCREALAAYRALHAALEALPPAVEPPRDLWPEIADRIAPPVERSAPALGRNGVAPRPSEAHAAGDRAPRALPSRAARLPRRRVLAAGAVVLLLLGAGLYRLLSGPPGGAWTVVSLEGSPRVGAQRLVDAGRLRVGEWLETDAASRARLDVGHIGDVEVGPRSRLQLRSAGGTDHRIALEVGRIEAQIWAPPRLFFVETPAALAIDLGCAYTLEVDSSGTSLLHVTAGYVELERGGRASVVPAGAMCLARPGIGPGTAFNERASEALRRALRRYDFEDGGAEALSAVLAEAGPDDGITLWGLFGRADASERGRIYDRLAALVPAPEGVTREGVLAGRPEMVEAWVRRLGLDVTDWWGALKKGGG